MNRVQAILESVGLLGPELPGWEAGKRMLRDGGDGTCDEADGSREPLNFLSANQRRRATPTMKLALQVAAEAVAYLGCDPKHLVSIFASSDGDLAISDRISNALCTDGRPVSPTDFHNSVHNAPAAYWSIATHATAPYQALAAYDATFSVGLLEALTECAIEGQPILYVCYDQPGPPTYSKTRDLANPFAVALVLSPQKGSDVQTRLSVEIKDQGQESTSTTTWLERLRVSNPAARSLPLLEAITRNEHCRVQLPYLFGRYLEVEIEPCRYRE